MSFRSLVFSCLFLGLLSACDGQYDVSGTILDAETKSPIENAAVRFYYPDSNRSLSGVTDAQGKFSFHYVSGFSKEQDGYVLTSKTGYKKKVVPYAAGKDSDVEIILEKN